MVDFSIIKTSFDQIKSYRTEYVHSLPEFQELLQENLLKGGVYHYPGIPDDNSTESFKELEKKLKEGPGITLMVVKKRQVHYLNPRPLG